MAIKFTHHARTRQQQRCIPEGIIDWLLAFGEREYDHHDGVRVVFTKASIKAMSRRYGRDIGRALEGYYNAYAVISVADDRVITTGYTYGGKKSPTAA